MSSEKCDVEGMRAMKYGDSTGFAKALSSRYFLLNGDGGYETQRGISNEILKLPKEDLDVATNTAIRMVESGWSPFAWE